MYIHTHTRSNVHAGISWVVKRQILPRPAQITWGVLQHVAACCSVLLLCVGVCCSMWFYHVQRKLHEVCCCMLQCFATVCCSVLQYVILTRPAQITWSVFEHAAVFYSVLQCVAVCVLPRPAQITRRDVTWLKTYAMGWLRWVGALKL